MVTLGNKLECDSDPSLIQQRENQLLYHNCIYVHFGDCFEVSSASLFYYNIITVVNMKN